MYFSKISKRKSKLLFPIANGYVIFPLLGLSISAIFDVTSGWIPTCDSEHSYCLYSAASQPYNVFSSMTEFSTQVFYIDTEHTGP